MSNTTASFTNLANKSIIITGGASGIGLATARAFASAGAYVTVADLPSSAGSQIASELSAQGQHVQFADCDTTVWPSLVSAFKKAVLFSPDRTLDVAVLAAGISNEPDSRLVRSVLATELSLDVDPPQPGKRTIEINLVGVYWSSWLALYYFRLPSASVPALPGPSATPTPTSSSTTTTTAAGPASNTPPLQKSLILFASAAAYASFASTSSTYWASKWGVRGLWQSIKHETQRVGARCNLIAPHYILTPMTAYLAEKVPRAAWARIEDVVEAVRRCATGEGGMDGRALGVFPEGIVDLGDDAEGSYAGPAVKEILEKISVAAASEGGGGGSKG
jgi:5'-hydroxyaverantin dehydrogenase